MHKKIAYGNQGYISSYNTCRQIIPLEQPLMLYQNKYSKNILHLTGSPNFTVELAGVYIITVDLYMNTPSQFTFFVNGIPDSSTTSGTDSGAGICTVAQIIRLNKGDVVSTINHTSAPGTVIASENAGGSFVGTNCNFFIFMLDV